MAKRVKVRGAARMQQLGKKSVQVWLDAEEYATIKEALEKCRGSVAAFVRHRAYEAARAVLAGKVNEPWRTRWDWPRPAKPGAT